MAIEQRLEALAHTVEILAQFQASHEANLDRLFELHAKSEVRIDRLFELQATNQQMQAKNEQMIAQIMESIDSLARIAHAHQQRIEDLEGRQ